MHVITMMIVDLQKLTMHTADIVMAIDGIIYMVIIDSKGEDTIVP